MRVTFGGLPWLLTTGLVMGTLFLAVAMSSITWTSYHVQPANKASQPSLQSAADVGSSPTSQEMRRIEWHGGARWFRWFSPAIGLSQGVADLVTWYRRTFQDRQPALKAGMDK